jgi:uncharacterized protein (DUF433 family)
VVWYNTHMKEMTREEFFASFPNLDADTVTEFWEDGYTVEEVEDYLSWLAEKFGFLVD